MGVFVLYDESAICTTIYKEKNTYWLLMTHVISAQFREEHLWIKSPQNGRDDTRHICWYCAQS